MVPEIVQQIKEGKISNAIDNIRALYPRPVAFNDRHMYEDAYCVGGACLLATSEKRDSRFHIPSLDFKYMLIELNPRLSDRLASHYASNVIHENDIARNFDVAWYWLEKALSYKPLHEEQADEGNHLLTGTADNQSQGACPATKGEVA